MLSINTYYESAIGQLITKQRALEELKNHSGSKEEYSEWLIDFYKEVGDREEYEATEVLDFLGY